MPKDVKDILKNQTPHSKAQYSIGTAEKHRSDGQLMEGKGPKPKTKTDEAIHLGHIVDSGQYNLRHDFDHSTELAFDYDRLSKEIPKDAEALKKQTLRILNPVWRKMGLKLTEIK